MNRSKESLLYMHLWPICYVVAQCQCTMEARRATHHFSLFNPLRGAQKRELTKRPWKEKEAAEGGCVGYSLLLQQHFKSRFTQHLLLENLNLDLKYGTLVAILKVTGSQTRTL